MKFLYASYWLFPMWLYTYRLVKDGCNHKQASELTLTQMYASKLAYLACEREAGSKLDLYARCC